MSDRPSRTNMVLTNLVANKKARKTDAAYAWGLWPCTVGHAPVIFLAPYLNYATGTSIAMLGLVSTIGRLYDALYDPLMGVISDRTPQRWGRRKPWVLIGYSLMLLVMVIGLAYLPAKSGAFSLMWMAIGLFFFFTMWTTAFIPYVAHAGEFTTDYDRRNRVNLWQGLVQISAGLVTYLIPYLLVDPQLGGVRAKLGRALLSADFTAPLGLWLSTPRVAGIANYGAVMMVLVWLTLLTTPIILWRYMRLVPERRLAGKAPSAGSILSAFRNPPFRLFSLGYLLLIAGFMGRLSLFPFVISYATGGKWSFLLLMVIQSLSGIVAGPLWKRIFTRFERTHALLLATAIEATGLLLLSVATSFSLAAPLAFLLIGLPGASIYLLPYLMAGDAADYARLRHGTDTRGVHIAIVSMILKLGSVFSSATLWVAGLLGFEPAAGITPSDIWTLKLLGIFIPAGLTILGGLLMAQFPISRGRYRIIQVRLDRRDRISVLDVPVMIEG